MMLAETVGLVEGTLVPQSVELPLSDPATHSVELHAHCLGPFLFDGIVGDASCHVVVSFNDGRGLWAAHLLEHCSDRAGFLAAAEEGTKFGLSRAGDNLVRDGTKSVDGSVERQGLSLEACPGGS
jgi:hypothetical protein